MKREPDLKTAIENMHGGIATFSHVMPVREMFGAQIVWDGEVQVFDLVGNQDAKRAYAWAEPIPNSHNKEIYAVLHVPPIDSALAAVKASIVHRAKAQKNKPAP